MKRYVPVPLTPFVVRLNVIEAAYVETRNTNSKGTSVTRQSNATKNSKPLSGKELGLDYEIGRAHV